MKESDTGIWNAMKLWLPASKAGRCFKDMLKHTSWSMCSPCPQHCVIYQFTSSQDHFHCYPMFISASWVNEPNPFIHTLLCVIDSSDAFWAPSMSKALARCSEELRVTPQAPESPATFTVSSWLQHSQHHSPCCCPHPLPELSLSSIEVLETLSLPEGKSKIPKLSRVLFWENKSPG